MNARNGSELALFNDCFELKDGERITASKLCEIMKLRGSSVCNPSLLTNPASSVVMSDTPKCPLINTVFQEVAL